MEVVNLLNQLFRRTGIESDGKPNVGFYCWMAIFVVPLVDIIVLVTHGTPGSNEWFTGIKILVLLIMSLSQPIVFRFFWNKIHGVLDIIAGIESIHGIESLIEENIRLDLFTTTKWRMIKLHHLLCNITFYYMVVTNTLMITVILIRIVTIDSIKNLRIESLPLPYLFYIPENLRLFSVYACVYILMNANRYITVANTFLVQNISFNAMRSLIYDLKLIGLSLKHFHTKVNSNIHIGSIDCNEKYLKQDLICIIRCHQAVYRKANILRRGIEIPVFIQLYCLTLVACVSVFLISRKEQLTAKLVEVLMAMLGSFFLLLINRIGQETTNQDEVMSQELYDCSWIDKPEWFKKMLLVMMTRNNVKIQIKPLGLFPLNLRTFSVFMNAVYSYYNILTNTKVK